MAGSTSIQIVTNPLQKLAGIEWFLEEIQVVQELGIIAGGFHGVPAALDDFKAGFFRLEPFRQFPPADSAGHDHVGNQQVNGGLMFLPDGQGIHPGNGFVNPIPVTLQHGAHQPPNGDFIFDEQDRLGAPLRGSRCLGFGQSGHAFGQTGQVDVENSSRVDVAFHVNPAVVLLDDAKNGGQPQTGAFAHFLGGEKRFEDVAANAPGRCRCRYR